jgi:2-methylcitrate dehydratase PrpD
LELLWLRRLEKEEGLMDTNYLFASHLVSTNYEDIPSEAVEAAKKEVLDSLATALGGSTKPGVGELVDIVKEWGGNEQSTIIAYGIKCPAPNAALVNGTMIHALEYDDGHPGAVVHVGCVAVSTCFAAAERIGKTNGKEFITAIALGGDFFSRLGLAACPGASALGTGWENTQLFGKLAAAAMAGKLTGLDEEKMINALGLAYNQCGGAGTGMGDGALAKRIGPGIVAKDGIIAALMAERGITGDRHPLEGIEGRGGLYNVYLRGDYDVKILTADLGKRFEGVDIGNKPYPCCGLTHPFIDATLALKSRHNIKAEQVRGITVTGGPGPYGMSQAPEKRAPRTIVDAQFSVAWTVATALVKGKVSFEDFTEEGIKREDILGTAQKVTGQLDPNMSRHGVGPGRVTIVMKDGAEYTEEVEHALGSVENPMTFEDCVAKFRECSSCSLKPLPADEVEKVIELIRHLEQVDDVREIIELLS